MSKSVHNGSEEQGGASPAVIQARSALNHKFSFFTYEDSAAC